MCNAAFLCAADDAPNAEATAETAPSEAEAADLRPFNEGVRAWSNRDFDVALNIFKANAEKGSAQAMTALGYMYTTGNGAPHEPETGISWYRQAIAAGDTYALYALGVYLRFYPLLQSHDGEHRELLLAAVEKKLPAACQEYFKHLIDEKKLDEAQELLMSCFADDQLWAVTVRGIELATGQGAEKDVDAGIALLKKAAERGDMAGNYHAGMAELGRGNADAAEKFHLEASENGYAPSMYELGRMYVERGEVEKGRRYLEDAGLNGFTDSYIYLGRICEDGFKVAKDLAAAAGYYKMAADIGDGDGYNEFGRVTELGIGVEKSESTAYDLYASGALAGSAEALFNQGRMEMFGIGVVKKDVPAGLAKLRECSSRGLSAATAILAEMYRTGDSVGKDEREAGRLLSLAAEQGDVESMSLAAERFRDSGSGEGVARAVELYEKAASMGHAPSQFALANLYADDSWHAPDLVSALRWYSASSDSGYPPALCAMGLFRLTAAKTDDEQRAAEAMVMESAETGYLPAVYALGRIYEHGGTEGRDIGKAMEYYKRAADKGEVMSMMRLASIASGGEAGGRPDYAEAFKWYKLAAEAGSVAAQTNVAAMYAEGRGTERDDREAFKWYSAAAERGGVQAKYNCAVMKMDAIGTWKDAKKAVELLRECAAQGYPPAQNELGLLYARGIEVERSFENAQLMLTAAADAGLASAQYNLGLLYSYNPEGEADPAAAVSCFEQAANQGHAAAAWHLGSAYEEGRGVEKDLSAARRYYVAALAGGDKRAEESIKRVDAAARRK